MPRLQRHVIRILWCGKLGVPSFGFRIKVLGLMILGLGFKVPDRGCRICNLRLRVSGLGFRNLG
jgi:hypothetical protein